MKPPAKSRVIEGTARGIGDVCQSFLGFRVTGFALELVCPLPKQRLPVTVSMLLCQSFALLLGDLLVVHPPAVVLDIAEVVPRRCVMWIQINGGGEVGERLGLHSLLFAPFPEPKVLRREPAVETKLDFSGFGVKAASLEVVDRAPLDFGVAIDAVTEGVVFGELGGVRFVFFHPLGDSLGTFPSGPRTRPGPADREPSHCWGRA